LEWLSISGLRNDYLMTERVERAFRPASADNEEHAGRGPEGPLYPITQELDN
jgi:hypothetical protein